MSSDTGSCYNPVFITIDTAGIVELKLLDYIKRCNPDYDSDDVITDIQILSVTMNKDLGEYEPRVNKPHTFNKWELPIIAFQSTTSSDTIDLFLNKEVCTIYLPKDTFISLEMMIVLKHNFNIKPKMLFA